MTRLPEVQQQITEMIKSDYPNPIFTIKSFNKMEFQFDKTSYHGTIMIEDDIIGDGLNLDTWTSSQFGPDEIYGSETVEDFMNEFKEIYKAEQLELKEYERQLSE